MVKSVAPIRNGFELLIKDLTRWKKRKIQSGTAVSFQNQGQPSGDDLREYDLRAFCPDEEAEPSAARDHGYLRIFTGV